MVRQSKDCLLVAPPLSGSDPIWIRSLRDPFRPVELNCIAVVSEVFLIKHSLTPRGVAKRGCVKISDSGAVHTFIPFLRSYSMRPQASIRLV